MDTKNLEIEADSTCEFILNSYPFIDFMRSSFTKNVAEYTVCINSGKLQTTLYNSEKEKQAFGAWLIADIKEKLKNLQPWDAEKITHLVFRIEDRGGVFYQPFKGEKADLYYIKRILLTEMRSLRIDSVDLFDAETEKDIFRININGFEPMHFSSPEEKEGMERIMVRYIKRRLLNIGMWPPELLASLEMTINFT